MNDMMPLFDKPIKIYVFKDEDEVSVSFRITDVVTINRNFTIAEFYQIVREWRDPGVSGMETEDEGKIWWEWRDCGPRPECEPADFVAVSFGGWNFRFETEVMEDICAEFIKQLNTKNHWDE